MNKRNNLIPTIWTTGWTDVFNTGTWRSALPIYQHRPSPCHNACPVEGDIPIWVQHLKNREYYESWLTLIKNNPFPAVTGRICHHPCQLSCNRNEYDETVAINALEHFVGDLALAQEWSLPKPEQEKEERVAIIGGGPAGLSAAYQLRLLGYQVTIFDAQAKLGGTLRYGIPAYRLAKDILDKEINRLLETGIKFYPQMAINNADKLQKLQQEYDAVFLAIGAHRPKKLPLLDYHHSWVLDGLDFLAQINCEQTPPIGNRVLVVGGGSAAIDVGRTARRLGKQVSLIALENRELLPAQRAEVEEALAEGITIYDGAMITSFAVQEKKGVTLACVKVTLDKNVPLGILKPAPIQNTDFTIEVDTVISAIGQDPDLSAFKELLTTENTLIKVNNKQTTSLKNVFAGGDVISLDRFVSLAIGSGKKAAKSIEQFLNPTDENIQQKEDLPEKTIDEVSYENINTFYFSPKPKVKKILLSPSAGLQSFQEIRANISEEEALLESERCFSCGNCLKCDNCFYFCPDMAIKKDSLQNGYIVLEQYCKGCGLCVEECPRGVVTLKEEIK